MIGIVSHLITTALIFIVYLFFRHKGLALSDTEGRSNKARL